MQLLFIFCYAKTLVSRACAVTFVSVICYFHLVDDKKTVKNLHGKSGAFFRNKNSNIAESFTWKSFFKKGFKKRFYGLF